MTDTNDDLDLTDTATMIFGVGCYRDNPDRPGQVSVRVIKDRDLPNSVVLDYLADIAVMFHDAPHDIATLNVTKLPVSMVVSTKDDRTVIARITINLPDLHTDASERVHHWLTRMIHIWEVDTGAHVTGTFTEYDAGVVRGHVAFTADRSDRRGLLTDLADFVASAAAIPYGHGTHVEGMDTVA